MMTTNSPHGGIAPFRGERIVAVLRGADPSRFRPVAEVLVANQISVVEVTLTSPAALETIQELAEGLTDAVVGAGTVLDAESAGAAVDAGARFLVTPTVEEEVMDHAARRGVPVICGAMTPTEILTAWRLGAAAVKVFPASVHGPSYVRAIRAPLPHVRLVPTGGVQLEEIPRYLDAGAMMVGLGGPLLGDSLNGGDLVELARRADVAHRAASVQASQ